MGWCEMVVEDVVKCVIFWIVDWDGYYLLFCCVVMEMVGAFFRVMGLEEVCVMSVVCVDRGDEICVAEFIWC